MKLVTYEAGGGPRVGVVLPGEQEILDVLAGLGAQERCAGRSADSVALARRFGGDMLGLIDRAAETLPALRELIPKAADLPPEEGGVATRVALSGARLLSPVPRPVSLRDGYAFRQHVEAARRNRGVPMIPEFDDFPVFYYSNHLSVIGPGPVVVRPLHLDKLDFELEAAVVLGRGGRDLDVAEADRTIFGLMVMNDWSARALQMEEMKLNLGPAKGKDFATALGPYLVPVEDLQESTELTPRGRQFRLAMSASVNGTPVAAGNLADMSWTFAEILARASYGVTLHAGEVLGSGTVGTGCFLETNGSKIFDNWWLKPGDEVVCEVAQLGRLSNKVVLDSAQRSGAPFTDSAQRSGAPFIDEGGRK